MKFGSFKIIFNDPIKNFEFNLIVKMKVSKIGNDLQK
jgi:hypothetical protein